MLLALKSAARFYEDGKEVHVSAEELMGTAREYATGFLGYAFVAYPNRDSTPYRERYGIPEARTVVRGTLRYKGFCEFVKVLVDIGYLGDGEMEILKGEGRITWKEVTQRILGATGPKEEDLVWAISSKTSFKDNQEKTRILEGLKWIGLFSDDEVEKRGNPLDTLCARLEKLMAYEKGERDLVFLQHRFEIEHKDGSKETRTSTLVENGDPKGYSAMAKLVGVPCGVATLMVLDGRISEKGILAPMDPKFNQPIMDELKSKYGIFLTEKTV